jgi:hypothetical protein
VRRNRERNTTMTKILRPSVCCILVTAVSLTSVWGQAGDFRKTTSLGVDVGLFMPVGQWTEHRIYPNVNQFQKGLAFGIDLERRFWKFMGLAVNMGYLGASTGDWEDYSFSQHGDVVEASAYMLYCSFLLRPYLLSRERGYLKAEIGFSFLGSQGQETFGPKTYDYDFFKPRAGFILGLEYDRFLSENVAIALRAAGTFITPGIDYEVGKDYLIIGFPITLGVRFHM